MTLTSSETIRSLLPLPLTMAKNIEQYRKTISCILKKKDPRWAIITGPCSLHHKSSALEFANKLSALQEKVNSSLFLVMRAHIEKPRTCLGWKGLLYDPHLQGQENLLEGIPYGRSLLLELAEKVPLASEFLDPIASSYFADLISWGFVGARTSSSPTHRQLASSLPMPIGFKNSLEGGVEGAVYGALTARSPHSFLHINEQGFGQVAHSQGNPNSHIVLRGSHKKPNYQPECIEEILTFSHNKGLTTPLIVDCSHGNSEYDANLQSSVFYSVLSQYLEGNKEIFGVMLESHIKGGSQPFDTQNLQPNISITDACLDWDTTEELILSAHKALMPTYSVSYSMNL